jgi:hypothetical protein
MQYEVKFLSWSKIWHLNKINRLQSFGLLHLRYAPLENSCNAALVEFSVDYHEGLGASHDLSTMDGVFG